MARPNNTIFAAWLRGGQTFGHTVAMVHGVIVFIGKWLLIPALCCYVWLFLWATNVEQEAGFLILQARLFEWFGRPAPDVLSIPVPGRGRENYHVSDVPYLPWLIPFAESYYMKVKHVFMVWFTIALTMCAIQTYLFTTSGKNKLKTRQIKGQRVVSASELLRQIRAFNVETKKKRNLPDTPAPNLVGIDYPIDGELEHTMITGGVGSGKSVAMHRLLRSIRDRGDRAIIYDPEGEYIRDHYNPETDVILNPFDERSPSWSPFYDATDQVDWDRLAQGIFKEPKNGDPYWTNISRSIFSWACYSIQSKSGPEAPADLSKVLSLFFGDTDTLRKHLVGTPASKHLGTESGPRVASIESFLTEGVQPLVYLLTGKRPFSIKKWINHPEKRPGFLFLSAPESHFVTLRPLLGFWADIAVSTLLSRMALGIPPIPTWIILDEFPSLGRVDSLAEGPARLRKHGGAMVFGLQQVSQLKDIYGTERALTIIGQCTNKLVLRANDPDTAKTMSMMLGERTMHRVAENTTYGANQVRDGVGIAPKEELEAVFNPTQIMNFPALQGVIKVSNRRPSAPFPLATIKFTPLKVPPLNAPYVPLNGPSPVATFLAAQNADQEVGSQGGQSKALTNTPTAIGPSETQDGPVEDSQASTGASSGVNDAEMPEGDLDSGIPTEAMPSLVQTADHRTNQSGQAEGSASIDTGKSVSELAEEMRSKAPASSNGQPDDKPNTLKDAPVGEYFLEY